MLTQVSQVKVTGITLERPTKPMSLEEILQMEMDNYNTMKGIDTEGYDCPKCMNRSSFAKIQDGYVVTVPCECLAIRKNLRRIKLSGLADVLEKNTFEQYTTDTDWQKAIKQKAMENVNTSRWFFIGGQTGSGKTHLCTAICKELINKGRNVKYMLWRDEVVTLKAFVNESEYFKRMDVLKNTEVLYIDDLFKTEQGKQPTQADIQIAFEIINYRVNNKKKTIVSTELNLSQVMDIDEATAGRMAEMAGKDFCINISRDRNKNYRLREFGTNF